MKLKNEAYDIIKWIVTILLPALSVLYAALAILWHFPAGVEVSGSLGAVAVFLGALMHTSTKQFNATPSDPEPGEGV